MAQHNELGKWGEDLAARMLEDKGYRIIARDWKDGHKDLDIVAIDDGFSSRPNRPLTAGR